MALVDSDTGEVLTDAEVIEEFTEDEAQRHVDKMRGSVQLTAELILEAWERRIWKPLGHKNWEAFIDAEFPGVGLNPAARQVLMVGLRNAGMSLRGIALTTGASRNTVRSQVGQIDPPDEVTGTDGKTYKATTRTTESTTVEFAGEGPGGDEPAPPSSAPSEVEPPQEAPSDDPAGAAIGDDAAGYFSGDTPAGSSLTAEPAGSIAPDVARGVKHVSAFFTTFSAERVRSLNDPTIDSQLDLILPRIADWFEAYENAKQTGLRVINGGEA